MAIDNIREIKQIALTALFADDVLMEKLVLKGGNLLDLVYGISIRASVDLDLSIDGDFDEDVDELKERICTVLNRVFRQRGYSVFDVLLRAVPPVLTPDRQGFWGGYKLEFKTVATEVYEDQKDDLETLRRFAIPIVDGGSTKLKVDLSRHEYCKNKRPHELDGYTIFAYAPETFVCEKVRAICQQMESYAKAMQSNPSARAKDFIDIYLVANQYTVDFSATSFAQLMADVFEMKKVPLQLIQLIDSQREFHREAFVSVEDTMKAGFKLQSFDFYFDYVVKKCSELKALRDE